MAPSRSVRLYAKQTPTVRSRQPIGPTARSFRLCGLGRQWLSGIGAYRVRHDELLDALEELEDIRAFDDAMAEDGENLPWEQVKAELGWK